MRILNVICVRSVTFLIILTVIADCKRQKEDPIVGGTRTISEVEKYSQDQFTVESSWRTSGDDLGAIIRVRRGREIVAAVNGEGTKRREEERKNNKRERERQKELRQRERDRERNAARYVAGKKGRKKEPLTRLHAKRPQRGRPRRPQYKNAGANRTRSILHRQRNHDRRNLEKQYLVRNRTLELFQRKTTRADNRSAIIHPVENLRGVIFERRITPEKIGQILGDGRLAPSIQIADLLIPKTFLDRGEKKNGVEIKPDDFESNYSETRDEDVDSSIGKEPCRSAETGSPLFLGKLKSIAMNVSRINEAVQSLRKSNSNVEPSQGAEDFGESSYRYDYENVFMDPSVSPWVNPPRSEEVGTGMKSGDYFLERALVSSVYMPIDDQVTLHQGLATLLSRMFQTLRNATDYENQELLQDLDFDNSVQGDLCQKWIDCKDKLEEAFLGPLVLPACPCHYPSSIFYDDKIWDEGQQRHFRWRDVSGEAERLDVYKPGATYCIRSLLAQGGGSAAAQHCCYDGRRRLLTRGSGAGTPNFVSPEVSSILHERIDILPWRLCKGDFSRFNKVRPPNNDNHCKGNPDEDEYQRQIDTTKHY